MVGGHINHSAQICWTFAHLELIKLYCCTNCKISFSGAVNLEAHLLTHTGEKPWRITLVPSKLLRGTRTLKRHLCNTQCSAQPYRCTVCKYGPTKLLCTNAHPLRSAVGNLLMRFFFSCPQQLNRTPCPSLAWSDQTNSQSLHNTTEWPQRLVTFETFDRSDEKTWPDQKYLPTYIPNHLPTYLPTYLPT